MPNIILVEDDLNVSKLVTLQLERAGYSVRHSPTIATGRELVRDGWDLAILDRGLPDGDGLDFAGELRAGSPHGYIIMLTGVGSPEAKLEGFARGADDYVTKPFPLEELLARVRAGVRIVRLQGALIETNRQLEELSLTDALTGVRNRRAFDERLTPSYEHSRRYDRPLSLAVVDVDHFKAINDTYGHDSGDAVLRRVAELISACTRQTDFVARVGGEEFGILLPETPLFEALQFGEKIRSCVAAATLKIGNVPHPVTISVGIANMPHSRFASPSELYSAADQALYRAKARGRNRVEMERRRDATRCAPAAQPGQVERRAACAD
ncbi:MAG TPA: diguanylate cyclase [Thermoanaerobaculia bacterium]|nr:diguanylate cyclase [Thermoanaerobaculia bacterium]